MSLLPPPLIVHRLPPPGPAADDAAPSHNPNLMPFSIDYTGPANVDGYLVQHTRSDPNSSSSTEIYSHFRGRRLFHAALPLPQDWTGATYFLYRDRPAQDFGVTDGAEATTSSASTSAAVVPNAKEFLEGGAAAHHGQDQAEREELLRRKKRRRLQFSESKKGNLPSGTSMPNARVERQSAKPAKAKTMMAFSMDEDDEDDEGQDPDEADLEPEPIPEDNFDMEEQPEFVEDEEDGFVEGHDYEDAKKGDVEPASGVSASKALRPQRIAPTRVTALAPRPHSSFSSINLWGPDGKLDMGDEELVKVFGEWQSVNALLQNA